MHRCGRCDHENPEGSKFCNSCGVSFRLPEDSPSSAEKDSEERVCPRCGMVVPQFRDICPNCLTQMERPGQVQARTRMCPRCGRAMAPGAAACTECIWDRQLHPAETEHKALSDRPR
jgi:RNA polymerase subunit RPABC4/transcription elongation factor Spt4